MMTHARIDSDGFVIALLNGALIPNLDNQADVVPAPPEELPPQGQAWRWNAATGWALSPDTRNPDRSIKLPGDPRTLQDHQANALQSVADELARRLHLPVTVEGSPFDADKVSRDRITGMILRLNQGRGLPDGWMGWRDYDNAMHWADATDAEVLAHLTALSEAIENREQALLVTGWTLKAQIEAAATVDQVQAIAWPE